MLFIKKITLSIFIIISSNRIVNAQKITEFTHFIPEVSVGYIFGVGTTWGLDLNVTAFNFDITDKTPTSAGIGVSFNRFHFNRNKLGNWGFNVVGFSDFAFIKLGGTWMRAKWGAGNRNKTTSNNLGFNMEIGGTFNRYTPFISFKLFDPANPCLWLPLRKQYQINLKYLYRYTTSFYQ